MRTLNALLAVAVLLPACSQSVLLKRPDDRAADGAVTELWVDEIRARAGHGDILVSRSYSFNGDVITTFTRGEDLSHAALYDAERDMVIESIGSGVREIPLARFVHRNHRVIVLRPAVSEARRAHAVRRARSQIGAKFDYTGLIGLQDGGRFYCTELVVWALGLEPESRIIAPSSMFAYGEVVWVSGARDSHQVVEPAVVRHNARVGTRVARAMAH